MAEVRLECRGLWKIFGPRPRTILDDLRSGQGNSPPSNSHHVAVRDASLEVRDGEKLVVMGLSGSGKSTLVRCLARLLEPTAGEIRLDGEDLMQMSTQRLCAVRREKLAMVFQHYGLLPHRTVIDNVAFGLEIRGIPRRQRRQRAVEVINRVGLEGWGERHVWELSGGMQQRVGLARALAVEPSIIFFDEPFSALDPLIRHQMQDELLGLQDIMQSTVVFITHDFLEAVRIGDRIAIMRNGEIVQVGTGEDIVARPADEYVAKFTQEVPRSKVLRVRNVMTRQWPTRREKELLNGLSIVPKDHDGGVPVFVVDDKEHFRGVLDLETAGGSATAFVQHPAIRHAAVARADARLEELFALFAVSDAPVPVVDDEGRLLGGVERRNVMWALAESDVDENSDTNGSRPDPTALAEIGRRAKFSESSAREKS